MECYAGEYMNLFVGDPHKPIIPDPQGDLNQLKVTISVTYEDSDATRHSKPSPLNFADPESLPPQGYLQ